MKLKLTMYVLTHNFRHTWEMCKSDVVLIPSALTFDASIVQMLLSWSSGCSMMLIGKQLYNNPTLLARALMGVTVMQVEMYILIEDPIGLLDWPSFSA